MAAPTASQMTAPTFVFAPGKTWVMPITYRQVNADGSLGTPIDLTGSDVTGILFTIGAASGIPLTVASGNLLIDPVNGNFTFVVPETTTAVFRADSPSPFGPRTYPNRLEVDIRDSLGRLSCAAIFPIVVFDPRFVDPGAFPFAQAGTIVAPAEQGPPGPIAGILNKLSASAILGHRVVKPTAQGVVGMASRDQVGDAGLAIGLSLGAATAAGQAIQVLTNGEVNEATWSFSIGPVFLDIGGALTQAPPSSGFLQQVGVASSPTTLVVDIQDAIVRT